MHALADDEAICAGDGAQICGGNIAITTIVQADLRPVPAGPSADYNRAALQPADARIACSRPLADVYILFCLDIAGSNHRAVRSGLGKRRSGKPKQRNCNKQYGEDRFCVAFHDDDIPP